MMKRMTGMEMMYGRDMFKGGDEFRPTFKLAYICNKLPKLPQDDNGTWRRILLYNFKSRFPAYDGEVPPTWQEQCEKKIFLRDKNLMSKIPQMRQAMMWIMLECFKRVMKRKTQPKLPEEVTSAIEQYREQNDYFLQFIKETLKKDQNGSISFNDFYAAFKLWYAETYNMRVPNKNECKFEMQNKPGWGDLTSDGKWRGWRMRVLQDDIEEGKAKAIDM
jgi:phage/plasmid-associated DNA primase